MDKDLSITEYCEQFKITRHAVHRRCKKYESQGIPINNIIDVKRIGKKIIILTINTDIAFVKRV